MADIIFPCRRQPPVVRLRQDYVIQSEDGANYEYPEDRLLQAFGVIQADEIHNLQHLDANGEPCHLVVKNSLTTGTTIGRVTGMEFFVRVYSEYGIKEVSMELPSSPMAT